MKVVWQSLQLVEKTTSTGLGNKANPQKQAYPILQI